jgi:hypothetical protein
MFPFFASPLKLAPGQAIPSAAQWNSLVDAVTALSMIDVVGANSVKHYGKQLSLDVSQVEEWDAKITATDGNGLYSWQEVIWNSGAWQNGPRNGNIASAGPPAVLASLPARELSGISVAVNGSAYVRMWYSDDAQITEFEAPGSKSFSGAAVQIGSQFVNQPGLAQVPLGGVIYDTDGYIDLVNNVIKLPFVGYYLMGFSFPAETFDTTDNTDGWFYVFTQGAVNGIENCISAGCVVSGDGVNFLTPVSASGIQRAHALGETRSLGMSMATNCNHISIGGGAFFVQYLG